MQVSTSGIEKGQGIDQSPCPANGERSLHDVNFLSTENTKEAEDAADMHRLGREQRLKVGFRPWVFLLAVD